MQKTMTYISLFSSSGVGCYGFKQEGFKCIATNEIIERRLNIQKINNKCEYETGYILGDIKNISIKQKIYDEIKKWEKRGVKQVDVVVATPPCQGMSVANHKKKEDEITRNSLIVESVKMVENISPKVFIFENVAAFWNTGCVDDENNIMSIGEMIMNELGDQYTIINKVINFKNYGANSSRTRTLVIGVLKAINSVFTPAELFPDFQEEKILYDVIGDMKNLEWGEYDNSDFYHSFRTYPLHMRKWIHNLKQGQSAFDNEEIELKPHKIINGEIVVHKSKNSDKYTRQRFLKVAPCIHTRNDQLASQNTIHPIDDRVFSIREIMRMMTIPESFKWINIELPQLNALPLEDKRALSKKEEINIRQSLGEAVPTAIFQQIAQKIKDKISKKSLSEREILNKIDSENLQNTDILKNFLKKHINEFSFSTITTLVELANANRVNNSAYYTNQFIVQEIEKHLPEFDKEEITIIEPTVGAGNFLPFLFKKYENIKRVNLIVNDIDGKIIEILKILYSRNRVPKNFNIKFIQGNYLELEHDKADLIVGNPPFTKLSFKERRQYLENNANKKATNLAEFIFEKALNNADYVSMILPKNILNTPEYSETRNFLKNMSVDTIIDLGEKGFKGVLIETINLIVNTKAKLKKTQIISLTQNINIVQKSGYIFDGNLPYWVIYRNEFFDEILKKMDLGIFNVYRDRQLTNSNMQKKENDSEMIRVIKSRNIKEDGSGIIEISGYNTYVKKSVVESMKIFDYYNNDKVYLAPNMTYKPRLIKKEKGYVVNGSVAILIPKTSQLLTEKQMKYIATDEFRKFYQIARNFQTRSLNIDTASAFWFGKNKEI